VLHVAAPEGGDSSADKDVATANRLELIGPSENGPIVIGCERPFSTHAADQTTTCGKNAEKAKGARAQRLGLSAALSVWTPASPGRRRALGLRTHYDYSYSDGGEPAFERSLAAYRRALAEAPDLVGEAAVPIILARVERGDRVAVYRDAKALVDAWPANARARYALAYVLRYAGLLSEAARECRAVYILDPLERRLRTCALSFIPLEDYDTARQFIRAFARFEIASSISPRWAKYRPA
jgi:tetratricopeptide (TPR) repeat protein